MDLLLNIEGTEGHQNATVVPAMGHVPAWNGQGHDRSVVLALDAGAVRMADELELRGKKGKQLAENEEGSLGKWPIMPTRLGLLPLFPAPRETGDMYLEANTQGTLRISHSMPMVEERDVMVNSFWSHSSLKRPQKEAHPVQHSAYQDHAGGEGSSRGGRSSIRKKMKLPKEGTAILEASFKDNPTVSPKQKDQLATKLKIKSRQVEVWFQNKRARLKLQQAQLERDRLQQRVNALKQENQMLESLLAQQSPCAPTHPFCTYQLATNGVSMNSSNEHFAPRGAMPFATSGEIAARSSFVPSPSPSPASSHFYEGPHLRKA